MFQNVFLSKTIPLKRSAAYVASILFLPFPLLAQNVYADETDPSLAPFQESFAEVAPVRELERSGAFAEAAPELFRLAEAGNPWAQNLLGTLFSSSEDGDVFADDYELAIAWYERAAAQGFPLAFHNLGRDWHQGFGDTPPDLDKAVAYFTQAADLGYATSMGELAMIYGAEDNAFYDPELGVTWIDKAVAIKPGDPWLLTIKADTFYFGKGRTQDFTASLPLYIAAAATGDAYGNTRAGVQYLYGEGFQADAPRARDYLEVAAEQDYTHAFGFLSDLYFYDYPGVEADDEKAYDYAKRAFESGDDWFGYILGNQLVNGRGVTQDFQAGRDAYLRALDAQHPEARNGLADMAYFGWGQPVDYEAAMVLLQANIQEFPDNPYTKFSIADILLYGHGTAPDIPTAVALFEAVYSEGGYLTLDVQEGLIVAYGHPDYAGDWSSPVRAWAHCILRAAEVGQEEADPEDKVQAACTHLNETLSEAEKQEAAALSETL